MASVLTQCSIHTEDGIQKCFSSMKLESKTLKTMQYLLLLDKQRLKMNRERQRVAMAIKKGSRKAGNDASACLK